MTVFADANRAVETKSQPGMRDERLARLSALAELTEILLVEPGTVMLNTWNIADPDDVAVVWGAVRGRCDVLVSGDNDFEPYFGTVRDGVRVLRPAALMRELQNLTGD